eukprot:3387433-Rhodomonas_salina.2
MPFAFAVAASVADSIHSSGSRTVLQFDSLDSQNTSQRWADEDQHSDCWDRRLSAVCTSHSATSSPKSKVASFLSSYAFVVQKCSTDMDCVVAKLAENGTHDSGSSSDRKVSRVSKVSQTQVLALWDDTCANQLEQWTGSFPQKRETSHSALELPPPEHCGDKHKHVEGIRAAEGEQAFDDHGATSAESAEKEQIRLLKSRLKRQELSLIHI